MQNYTNTKYKDTNTVRQSLEMLHSNSYQLQVLNMNHLHQYFSAQIIQHRGVFFLSSTPLYIKEAFDWVQNICTLNLKLFSKTIEPL